MAYRTKVNGVEVFGDNNYPYGWIDFIKSQGIEVDEEGRYEGNIKDIEGAIDVIEKSIMLREEEARERAAECGARLRRMGCEEEKIDPLVIMTLGNKSIFDFRYVFDNKKEHPKKNLTFELMDLYKHAYIFDSCHFIEACGNSIKWIWMAEKEDMGYILKPGKTVHICAG